MVKAVLFDLDGTFADTAHDLGAALNYTRATRQLPPLPHEQIRPQASHGARGLLKIGFGIDPDHPDFNNLREIFLQHYEQNICVHTTLFPGIAQLINTLEQRHIPWAIVTNKPHRYTVPLMQALGYSERAACLISGDTCAYAKPHPAPLLKACEIMQVPAADCLYLGDDLRDMQAAQTAGMPGVIAGYGYIYSNTPLENWGAAHHINHASELIPLLN